MNNITDIRSARSRRAETPEKQTAEERSLQEFARIFVAELDDLREKQAKTHKLVQRLLAKLAESK